jgi:hypothetical protein
MSTETPGTAADIAPPWVNTSTASPRRTPAITDRLGEPPQVRRAHLDEVAGRQLLRPVDQLLRPVDDGPQAQLGCDQIPGLDRWSRPAPNAAAGRRDRTCSTI